jgi:Tfp pilus assembly protein PilO
MTARDRTLLAVIAAIAALAGFWFLAIKPKRAEISTLEGQVATQTARLQTAQTTLSAGLAAKSAYPRNYATVSELGKALPADDDIASLLYQLDATSHGEHIDFKSISRGSAAADSTSGSSSSSTSSTGAAATSAASLPPGATVGTAGLATLPFSFTFSGSFFDLQHFLAGVQGFVRSTDSGVAVRGRLLTINGVSLVPDAGDLSHIQAKIAATAYLAPSKETAQSGTAASGSSNGSDPSTTTAPAPTSSAMTGGSN